MEDQTTSAPETPQQPLQPSSVEQIQSQPAPAEIEIPRGHVLVAELDANGEESGILFTVAERGFNRLYSDETKFKLKKKAQ